MSAAIQDATAPTAAPIWSPGTGKLTPGETVASLHSVTKRYRNGVIALDGVSVSLQRGEIVALLGPNGAGKSTAVKLMMGLSAPSRGEARTFGQNPRFAHNRLRTGVMLQVGRAPETLKVREHIELFRGYYPRPLALPELIRIAGLEGLEERLFGQLSGGQKQRVLFALALAGDPDLVFLDEPTVGLDVEARRGMWTQIRALAAHGKTVLLTTHYLEEADALANRIIVIAKGRVLCEGTPSEIKARGAEGMLGAAAGASTERVPDGATAKASSRSKVRIIRCVSTLDREHLLLLPGVAGAEQHAGRWSITSAEPEATLRHMLALDSGLGELEVVSPALEDAFLALTAE